MTIETFKEQQQKLQDMLDEGPQMWALYLNDMRMSKIEQTTLVAIFDTAELAQAFLDDNRLPDDKCLTIKDAGRAWEHSYRPGPLWMFNPPFSYPDQGILPCDPWVEYFRPNWLSGSAPPQNPVNTEPFHILRGDISEETVKQLAEWQREGKI